MADYEKQVKQETLNISLRLFMYPATLPSLWGMELLLDFS